MRQVTTISVDELKQMSQKMSAAIVKADVDISKKIVLVDMGMHADGEAEMLENGSEQADLWGINLHPDLYGSDDFIEYESMINIKPSQGNASMTVLDPQIKQRISDIIEDVVHA